MRWGFGFRSITDAPHLARPTSFVILRVCRLDCLRRLLYLLCHGHHGGEQFEEWAKVRTGAIARRQMEFQASQASSSSFFFEPLHAYPPRLEGDDLLLFASEKNSEDVFLAHRRGDQNRVRYPIPIQEWKFTSDLLVQSP
jgi:hypothetical protein